MAAIRADSKATSSRTTSAAQFEFVGTWEGASGNLFQLRTDGTGRCRSRQDTANSITYIEWEGDKGSLAIIYASRKTGITATARRMVFGRGAMDRYDVNRLSSDRIELIDASDGTTYTFRRCSDDTLSSAP